MKRLYGRCFFCPDQTDYEVLQCHRVVPGCDGGKYLPGNVVVLCANCHSLVTSGKVLIHQIRMASYAEWVVNFTGLDGVNQWRALTPSGQN